MTPLQQYDLFGEDLADETRRYRDALTALADVVDDTLSILIGVRNPHHGETRASARGPWAWSVTTAGLHVEDRDEWGRRGRWSRRPADLVTWTELDHLIGGNPRLPEIRAWSESLTAIDAWRDRQRPATLGPSDMHPSYAEDERQRTGWPERLRAWQQAIAICRDAADRL